MTEEGKKRKTDEQQSTAGRITKARKKATDTSAIDDTSFELISPSLLKRVQETEAELAKQRPVGSRSSSFFADARPLLVPIEAVENLVVLDRSGEMKQWIKEHKLDSANPLQEPIILEFVYDSVENRGLLGIFEGHHRLLRLRSLGAAFVPVTILVLQKRVFKQPQEFSDDEDNDDDDGSFYDEKRREEEYEHYKPFTPPAPLADKFGYIARFQVTPADIGLPIARMSVPPSLTSTSTTTMFIV